MTQQNIYWMGFDMTLEEIHEGIYCSETIEELKAHLDIIQVALDNDECLYGDFDWDLIAKHIRLAKDRVDSRVLH